MRDQPPPIAVEQNSAYSQRLLAAQSRLYSDAKRIHDARILAVLVLAASTALLALRFPDLRLAVGGIGGTITFVWSIVASQREKRCARDASLVQEAFDIHVFDLPWNGIAADRPSPTVIAEAASRYRGHRTKDWYPDTRNVVRPLDVLICQRTNLGWGTSTHHFYASFITGVIIVLIAVGMLIAIMNHLSVTDALVSILIPFLAPIREFVETARAHRDSAVAKASAESKVLALWRQGLENAEAVAIADCRALQDLILNIRQNNAHIPDWLDGLRRNRNESTMQASADHLIAEAARHGHCS
jgi:hypothetical protein